MQRRWLPSHVGQEAGITVSPLRRDLDTSPPVVFERFDVRVQTSVDGVLPRAVLRRSAVSVRSPWRLSSVLCSKSNAGCFVFQAPARATLHPREMRSPESSSAAAVASAFAQRVRVAIDYPQNNKTAEPLSYPYANLGRSHGMQHTTAGQVA
jgi:hypothetical protein